LHSSGEIGGRFDFGQDLVLITALNKPVGGEISKTVADPAERSHQAFFASADQDDLFSRHGENLRHAMTYNAVADHGDGRTFA
jgi:hypothetical protein